MRKFDRTAVVRDLLSAYPDAVRLAALLSGSERTARGVGRFILSRAVEAWRTWAGPEQQRAWFFHHTLLATRRAMAERPGGRVGGDDVFLSGLSDRGSKDGSDVAYRALIAAMRELPHQQSEAWILFDVLGFDLRQSAVTMDLSTTATQNHLSAARAALMRLAGPDYATLLARAAEVARGFAPDTAPAIPAVRSAVSRYLWPRRLRWAGVLLLLLALLSAAWWAWTAFSS